MYGNWDGTRTGYSRKVPPRVGHVCAVLQTRKMDRDSGKRQTMAHSSNRSLPKMASESKQCAIDSANKEQAEALRSVLQLHAADSKRRRTIKIETAAGDGIEVDSKRPRETKESERSVDGTKESFSFGTDSSGFVVFSILGYHEGGVQAAEQTDTALFSDERDDAYGMYAVPADARNTQEMHHTMVATVQGIPDSGRMEEDETAVGRIYRQVSGDT